ncbi:hypothetical protein ACFV4I_10965 [Nocardiopsis alba]|uniref:hypothetical protein n=1 Tax=Nocardiopsis alba TaxID=53437 RepID=UPI00340DC8D8
MSSHLGLTEQTTIGDGGRRLSEEADLMRHQMDLLIADMEGIPKALVGTAGFSLSGAAQELQNRFSELMGWCSSNGIKLGENQESVNTAEVSSSELIDQAGNNLGNLSRPINA